MSRPGLAGQMLRLARHSAIYGLGGLIARLLAVGLLPLYTRDLSPSDYGAIETLIALVAVLTVLLRFGTAEAFLRFYYVPETTEEKLTVVRTAFWFTMTTATLGLVLGQIFAPEISHVLFGSTDRTDLVRAAFVGLWAQMNFMQLTSLFRVEERSVSFAIASVSNVIITITATLLLVVVFHQGPLGVIVGNFTGTLVVYVALVLYRREQLGLEFNSTLFWKMEHFGMPLVPAALALWAVNFIDRFFLVRIAGQTETGLYSIGVRIASVGVFMLMAFRTAWPAFAYSIEDDREARRTYPYVLTYLILASSWLSLALGVLAPWIVRVLATPAFYDGAQVVPLLAFGTTAFAGYVVVVIGVGRVRKTQFNWIVTGIGAAVNIGLCATLIPDYGQMGAAIATAASYAVMFAGMAWNAQRRFPVPYQWRRVLTAMGAAIALTIVAKLEHVSLPFALLLVIVYPLTLGLLGFYLPRERKMLRRLLPV
jgi:O-antigen/teichoic acid export membrane protein